MKTLRKIVLSCIQTKIIFMLKKNYIKINNDHCIVKTIYFYFIFNYFILLLFIIYQINYSNIHETS